MTDWAEEKARWVVEMSADGSLVNNIAALLRQEVREREAEADRTAREECAGIAAGMAFDKRRAAISERSGQVRWTLQSEADLLDRAARAIRSTIKEASA